MSRRSTQETPCTVLQSQNGPMMTRVQKNNRLKQPCTTSSGHRERCHNPICHNPLEPIENGWRRTDRLYCSDKCRQDASIIKRAAKPNTKLPNVGARSCDWSYEKFGVPEKEFHRVKSELDFT